MSLNKLHKYEINIDKKCEVYFKLQQREEDLGTWLTALRLADIRSKKETQGPT